MTENTIEDIRKLQIWLEVRCENCGRCVQIPHGKLPAKLKPDLPARLAAAYFRCQKCESRNLTSRGKDLLNYELPYGRL